MSDAVQINMLAVLFEMEKQENILMEEFDMWRVSHQICHYAERFQDSHP